MNNLVVRGGFTHIDGVAHETSSSLLPSGVTSAQFDFSSGIGYLFNSDGTNTKITTSDLPLTLSSTISAWQASEDSIAARLAPTLESSKFSKKYEINEARNTAESSGFSYLGHVFDSDTLSVQRISVAVMAAQAVGPSFSIDWMDKSNAIVTLDQSQMLGMPSALAQHGYTQHVKARSLKNQVDAATTIAEVNAITW